MGIKDIDVSEGHITQTYNRTAVVQKFPDSSPHFRIASSQCCAMDPGSPGCCSIHVSMAASTRLGQIIDTLVIQLTSTSSNTPLKDNVTFGGATAAPEPGSLGFFGLGHAGFIGAWNRMRDRRDH